MTDAIPDHHFEGPMAWLGDAHSPDDGVFALDAACRDEIAALAEVLRAHPLPTTALSPDDFRLDACRGLAAAARRSLNEGVGFAILDRLPVAEMDADVATGIYWLLMSMIARPVAQKWDGTMVYDVTDTGRKPAAGNGVRSSKSNQGQGYHTDNAFNLPPDYVALLCLRPAKEGGRSGLVSFETAHNRLREEHPAALRRLARPFPFDRQREHAPGDVPTSRHPVFSYEGRALSVRVSSSLIRQGYEMEDEPMDPETGDALAALDEVIESPQMGRTFDFEPGQIQILNNRRIGHRRTAYTDWDDPQRKRHLVRIWMRNQGRPFYLG